MCGEPTNEIALCPACQQDPWVREQYNRALAIEKIARAEGCDCDLNITFNEALTLMGPWLVPGVVAHVHHEAGCHLLRVRAASDN